MDFCEYQKKALTTVIYPKLSPPWIYPALGLGDESGEVLGKLKKVLRDGGGVLSEEKKAEVKKELGDVLWYVAVLCHELDLDLDEVARLNIEKLSSRKDRGVLQGSGDHR